MKYWVVGTKYWVAEMKYWVVGTKYWVAGERYCELYLPQENFERDNEPRKCVRVTLFEILGSISLSVNPISLSVNPKSLPKFP